MPPVTTVSGCGDLVASPVPVSTRAIPVDNVTYNVPSALMAIPFASLDEINFRRDAIGSRTLEAKLRFTLYLNDVPAVAQRHVAPDLQGSRQ